MNKLLMLAVILGLLLGCSKDKFQTRPQIQIKYINNTVVPINGSLDMIFTYTDKEGDLQGNIFIAKIRTNIRHAAATLNDTLNFAIPDFPSNSKGDIEVNLDYNTVQSASPAPKIPGTNPAQYESDTLLLRVAVTDKAGHTSDTLTTPQIVVLREQ